MLVTRIGSVTGMRELRRNVGALVVCIASALFAWSERREHPQARGAVYLYVTAKLIKEC